MAVAVGKNQNNAFREAITSNFKSDAQLSTGMGDYSFDRTVHEAHQKEIKAQLKKEGKWVEPDWDKIRENQKKYAHITKDLSTMSLQEWLKIVIATVQHQDPEDPIKPHEVAAMMSQMGMASGVATVTQKMDDMMATINEGMTISSSSNTGRLVEAESNKFKFDGQNPKDLGYELPETCGRVTVTIFNEEGKLIKSHTIDKDSGEDGLIEGRNLYTWDGKDALGNPMKSGIYTYSVQAKDKYDKFLTDEKTGRPLTIKSYVTGEMEACYMGDNGNGKAEAYILMDGIKLPMDNIRAIKGKPKPVVEPKKTWADKIVETRNNRKNLMQELQSKVPQIAPIAERVGTNTAGL